MIRLSPREEGDSVNVYLEVIGDEGEILKDVRLFGLRTSFMQDTQVIETVIELAKRCSEIVLEPLGTVEFLDSNESRVH